MRPEISLLDEVSALAMRDIAREQTDFLGRMGQCLGAYDAILDESPDGNLSGEQRDDAVEEISGLCALALAQLAMLRFPEDPADLLRSATPPVDSARPGERFIATIRGKEGLEIASVAELLRLINGGARIEKIDTIPPKPVDPMWDEALSASLPEPQLGVERADVQMVPLVPTEAQWGGLARAIMMWLDMSPKTPRALFNHLRCTGEAVPDWLRDEPEMKHLDHVPSKGTRCAIIYRAMIEAYSSALTVSSKEGV